MQRILVLALQENQFSVTVEAETTTIHHVTVQADYAQKLTLGKISTALLVEKSFTFLLKREPNTSILRTFDLSLIEHYFPEYVHEISMSI
jgi:hypothetical protein